MNFVTAFLNCLGKMSADKEALSMCWKFCNTFAGSLVRIFLFIKLVPAAFLFLRWLIVDVMSFNVTGVVSGLFGESLVKPKSE